MYVFRVEHIRVKATVLIHAYSPITTTSPSNEFWGINQSVRYGTSTTILTTTAGIVDTGKLKSSWITIIDDPKVFYHRRNHPCPSCHEWTDQVQDRYRGCCRRQHWIAPHHLNPILGSAESVLHSWWCTYFPSARHELILINFIISSFFSYLQATFELTANAQLWPRSLNTDIGGVAGLIYLIVNDLGSPSGEGLDFINGYGFLERFYSVFDTANKRVGLATTPFTHATTN